MSTRDRALLDVSWDGLSDPLEEEEKDSVAQESVRQGGCPEASRSLLPTSRAPP